MGNALALGSTLLQNRSPHVNQRFQPILLLASAFLLVAADDKTPATSSELKETIARLDTSMFDAFNAHDADRLMALFTGDLEFYHDKGGLTDYQQTGENFRKLFANTPDIRRELVPGTLEVYPIKDFGAIEIGAHRFCHQESGKDDCDTFRFLHVWRKTGDSWQVSRVISYGH